MALHQSDAELLLKLSPRTRLEIGLMFWCDAVGAVTKLKARRIDPCRNLFKRGVSEPLDLATHVGKENRCSAPLEAITDQFPGRHSHGSPKARF